MKKTRVDMARPPADKPKSAILNFRTHPEIRKAIEAYARVEHRSLAAMSDLLIREAIIARRKSAGEKADDIAGLP